jgi:hypothetical protein
LLQTLYYILLIISFLILIYRIKQRNEPLRFFIPLLLLSLIVEGVRFGWSSNRLLSDFLFSIYTPVEYLLLSLFFIIIINSKFKRRLIQVSIPLFIILSLYVQFEVQSANYFYKYLDVLLEAPLILTWTLFYFFQLFTDEESFNFKTNPLFWISSGNLLFFCGSFFSYGFGSYLHNINEQKLSDAVFWIARVLNIFLYVFYIIAFLCSDRKK